MLNVVEDQLNRQKNMLNSMSYYDKPCKIDIDSSLEKISIDSILKERKNILPENLNDRRDQILHKVFGFDDFRSKKQRDAVTYVLQSNYVNVINF